MTEDNSKTQIQLLMEFLESFDPETGLTVSHALQVQVEKEQAEAEAFWSSLTEEQRLRAFCAVVKRIHDGEMKTRSSFRGVLYTTFGFGPHAYASAMHAGYMDIHNALFAHAADQDETKNKEDQDEDQTA